MTNESPPRAAVKLSAWDGIGWDGMLSSRKRHTGPNQEGVADDFGGFRKLYRRSNGIRVSEDSLDLVLSLILSIAFASHTSTVTEISVSERWGLVVVSVQMGHFCGEGREMGQTYHNPKRVIPEPQEDPEGRRDR